MKRLNTVEEVTKIFEQQIQKNPRCTGDFLNGMSVDDAVKRYQKNYETLSDTFSSINVPDDATARLHVMKQIQQVSEHIDDISLFYVITKRTNHRFEKEILQTWKSNLHQLVGYTYEGLVKDKPFPVLSQ